MASFLFVATCFLAYANGANDNFKGVATLLGTGTGSYQMILYWATMTTLGGSVCAMFIAQTLLTKFSGKGLVPEQIVSSPYFLLAVALGAGIAVILAAIKGFPISTTHALIGAIIGSGLAATGGKVNLQYLGRGFLLPLLLSPILAIILVVPFYLILHFSRLALGVTKDSCICVGQTIQVITDPEPASVMALQSTQSLEHEIVIGSQRACSERFGGTLGRISYQGIMDAGHFFSAGVVSFARGLNDTPKIAALLLVVRILDVRWGMLAIGAAIATGGLLGAKRVAETMSHRITPMNHGQGFSANLTTGVLVILASLYGLPVSTTHVSVGSLMGVGLLTRTADIRVIKNILLAWLITLPCAALMSTLSYDLIVRF